MFHVPFVGNIVCAMGDGIDSIQFQRCLQACSIQIVCRKTLYWSCMKILQTSNPTWQLLSTFRAPWLQKCCIGRTMQQRHVTSNPRATENGTCSHRICSHRMLKLRNAHQSSQPINLNAVGFSCCQPEKYQLMQYVIFLSLAAGKLGENVLFEISTNHLYNET